MTDATKSFIFFLDMDGVLNNSRITLSQHRSVGPGLYGSIDPVCVAFINRWADMIHEKYHDDVEIVLSSTWRGAHDHYRSVDMMLGVMGLVPPAHSNFKTRRTGMTIDGVTDIRGNQIADWLEENPGHGKWMIIDDDSDFTDEQKTRHVKTDVYNGILMEHHIKAEEIIKGIYDGNL